MNIKNVCALTSELLPLSTREEEGMSALYGFYVSPVEGNSGLRQPVWLVVSVSCLCLCVFVTGVHAQHYYWLNLQGEKQQVHPPVWAETLGP